MSLSKDEEIRLIRAVLAEQGSPALHILRQECARRLKAEDERLRALDGVPLYRAQGRANVLAEILDLTDADRLRMRLKAIEAK